jgi:hypothetical protein
MSGNISNENAKALWEWKGDEEFSETRERIFSAKKTIQKLANKCQSGKGDTLKQLEAINILSGDLIQQVRYLKDIHSIKDIATL